MSSIQKIKALGISALCAFSAVFTACSSDDGEKLSGVLTETESGKTIAGTVSGLDGKAAVDAKVYLLKANHVAARTAPVQTVFTQDNGSFTIDSIPEGDYALQIQDESNSLSAYTTISISKSNNNRIDLEKTSLAEDASLELPLSDYALAQGDTFCITGTINCAVVDSAAIASQVLLVKGIPAAEFANISLIKANEQISEQEVHWSFKEGKTLYAANIDSSKIVGTYTMEIPAEAFDSINAIEAPHFLNNIIVPVTLEKPFKNPSLMGELGERIPLTALSGDESQTRFVAVIKEASAGTYKFSVLENDSAETVQDITRAYAKMEKSSTIDEGDFWGGIQLYHHSLAISFWIEADGSTIQDQDAYILNSVSNDVGFKIGQCEAGSSNLCTAIYNRLDSVSNDTIFMDKVNLLDGQRHHYSLVLKEKHVSISIDGKTLRDTDCKTQSNIYVLPGISTGNYDIEDLLIYSIPDSIRQNNDKEWERLKAWLYAFYYIAQHEDSRSR